MTALISRYRKEITSCLTHRADSLKQPIPQPSEPVISITQTGVLSIVKAKCTA